MSLTSTSGGRDSTASSASRTVPTAVALARPARSSWSDFAPSALSSTIDVETSRRCSDGPAARHRRASLAPSPAARSESGDRREPFPLPGLRSRRARFLRAADEWATIASPEPSTVCRRFIARGRRRLPEAIEHVGQKVGTDPTSPVSSTTSSGPDGTLDRDVDAPFLGSELDGVRPAGSRPQLKTAGIALTTSVAEVSSENGVECPCLRERPDGVDAGLGDGRKIHRIVDEVKRARDDS